MSTTTRPTAGGILAATTAMQDPARTYSRAEVAYLMRLAYDSGRTARYVADLAETHAGWARNRDYLPTAAQRYAERMAEMAAHGAQISAELGRPPGYEYRGGAVDWETGVTA